MSHYGMIVAQPPAHFTHPRLQIRTAQDAHRVFEAVRLGILPLIRRRLSPSERDLLASGQVFVWEEAPTGAASGEDSSQTTSGLERWTDGRRWSQSRMREPFLFYEEKIQTTPEEKQAKADRRARKASGSDSPQAINTLQPIRRQDRPTKPDGLTKQTYSSYVYLHPSSSSSSSPSASASSPSSTTTGTGAEPQPRKWHCVAYFSASDWSSLPGVEAYPDLRDLVVPEGVYVSTKGTGKTGAPPPLVNGTGSGGGGFVGGPPTLTLALPNPPSYPPPLPPTASLPPVPHTTGTSSANGSGASMMGSAGASAAGGRVRFPMTTPTSTSSSSATSMNSSRWSPSCSSSYSPVMQYASPVTATLNGPNNNNNSSSHHSDGGSGSGGVGPIRRPTSRGSYTSASPYSSTPPHHFSTPGGGGGHVKGRANSLSSSTTSTSSSLSVVRSSSASVGASEMPSLAPFGRSTSYQGHRSQHHQVHSTQQHHHHYSSSISSASTGSPPTPGFMAPIPSPGSFQRPSSSGPPASQQQRGGHHHYHHHRHPLSDDGRRGEDGGEDVVMVDAPTVRTPTKEYPRRRASSPDPEEQEQAARNGSYFSSSSPPPPSTADSSSSSSSTTTSMRTVIPSAEGGLPSLASMQWSSGGNGPAGRSKEDSQALGAFRLSL